MIRAAGATLLGAALVLCGALFDSPSLHVPGVALFVLGLGAGGWVALAAWGASVHRTLGPRTVEEEHPYPVEIEMRAGLVAPPGGELVEPLLGRPVRLRRERVRRVRVEVLFSRRGRRALEAARVAFFDPLRLAVAERSTRDAGEVIVLPRIEPVVAGGAPGRTGALTQVSGHLSQPTSELELDSLRPYRPGAPASRIHWPTVARTGELVERRLVADADARPLVVLDTRHPESEDALDRAVRAAASLVVALAKEGGCGLLMPGDRRPVEVEPDLMAWAGLHVRLALVAAGGEPPAASRLHRAGALVWVTASRGRIPAGLERAPAAARWLVTAAERGPQPAFTVAGCFGYRLGRGARPGMSARTRALA